MASNTNIGIALVLSAHNRASAAINAFINNTQQRLGSLSKRTSQMADNSFKTGQQMVAAGTAAGLPVIAAVKSFADQEEAMLSLKSVMMNAQGQVSRNFENINRLAVQLGDKLPGTTRDMYGMFETMVRNGGRAEDILSGTGKAAAYLGVQLKLPYNEAGELMQRLQVATGVANSDMLRFADTLARINQLGPSTQEMQMAFQRSAGELKSMKLQGIDTVSQLSNVYAILIKTMGSGERVGTGFAAILASMGDAKAMAKFNDIQKFFKLDMKFTNKQGDFLGIENMMQQFDKMKNLTVNQKNALITALVGAKGGDSQIVATLVNEGMAGYRKMQQAQAEQADLNKKVELQLKSLKLQWDAITGTISNGAAAIASTLKPQLDAWAKSINDMLPKLIGWVNNHRALTAGILKGMVVFSGLALAGGYLAFVFGGIAKGASIVFNVFKFGISAVRGLQFAVYALRFHFVTGLMPALRGAIVGVRAFGAALLANPLTWYVAGAVALAGVVYLVYRNWSKISGFFGGVWDKVKAPFVGFMNWFRNSWVSSFTIYGVYKHWGAITGFFKGVWNGITTVFTAGVNLARWTFMNLTPAGWLIKYWKPISMFFKGVWDLTVAVFKAAVYGVWLVLKNMTPVGLVYKYWIPITGFFRALWGGVKLVFAAGAAAVKYVLLNMTPVGLIYRNWAPITGFFSALWGRVKAVFLGFFKWVWNFGGRFVHAGEHIIESIISGIMNKIGKVGQVMSNVAAKIRAYLPFSPAKEGALRDIHRIRLIETIAESIRPDALVNRMQAVMGTVRGVVGKEWAILQGLMGGQMNYSLNGNGVAIPKGDVQRDGSVSERMRGMAQQRNSTVNNEKVNNVRGTVVFAPVIHLNGGATKADGQVLVDAMKPEWERWYRDMERNKARVSFNS